MAADPRGVDANFAKNFEHVARKFDARLYHSHEERSRVRESDLRREDKGRGSR